MIWRLRKTRRGLISVMEHRRTVIDDPAVDDDPPKGGTPSDDPPPKPPTPENNQQVIKTAIGQERQRWEQQELNPLKDRLTKLEALIEQGKNKSVESEEDFQKRLEEINLKHQEELTGIKGKSNERETELQRQILNQEILSVFASAHVKSDKIELLQPFFSNRVMRDPNDPNKLLLTEPGSNKPQIDDKTGLFIDFKKWFVDVYLPNNRDLISVDYVPGSGSEETPTPTNQADQQKQLDALNEKYMSGKISQDDYNKLAEPLKKALERTLLASG